MTRLGKLPHEIAIPCGVHTARNRSQQIARNRAQIAPNRTKIAPRSREIAPKCKSRPNRIQIASRSHQIAPKLRDSLYVISLDHRDRAEE